MEDGGQKCIAGNQHLQATLLPSPLTQEQGFKEEQPSPALRQQNQAATDSGDKCTPLSPFRAAAASAHLVLLPSLPLLLMCVQLSGSTADLLLSASTVILLALLLFLNLVFQRTTKDKTQMRCRLKTVIWLGLAVVNLINAYRLAALVPFGVWCAVEAYTLMIILYLCLVRRPDSEAVADDPSDDAVDDVAKCPV